MLGAEVLGQKHQPRPIPGHKIGKTMPATNHVSATVTAEQKQTVLTALDEVEKNLPFLSGLSAEDRSGLAKMGTKSLAFVEQAVLAAEANPSAIPPAFDIAEFRRDLDLWQTLQPIAERLARLNELVDDTLLALGSDLYTGGLSTYGYLKAAGSTDGLDELKSQLSRRFARRSTTTTTAKTTTST